MSDSTNGEKIRRLVAGFVVRQQQGSAQTAEDVRLFCSEFEGLFNVEREFVGISDEEYDVLDRLFNATLFYSPYPKDREAYEGYVDEKYVSDAAAKSANILGWIK